MNDNVKYIYNLMVDSIIMYNDVTDSYNLMVAYRVTDIDGKRGIIHVSWSQVSTWHGGDYNTPQEFIDSWSKK